MKNFSDEELKKWLAEEYYREVDAMEKKLFPDGNIPECEDTEEETRAAYAKLVKRLKADGIYEEQDDQAEVNDHEIIKDKKTEEAEKEKIVYLPAKKKYRFAHVAVAAIICAAGVFAVSMTSQANRSYFVDSVKIWSGNDTSISVDNDVTNDEEDAGQSEKMAIDVIKNGLSTELVPELMYRPSGFSFKDYKVSADAGYAWMEYDYKDTVVSIYMSECGDNRKSSNQLLDGKILETINKKEEGFEIKVISVKDKNDKAENYAAYWEKNNMFYQISGKMEKKEFLKLIDNLYF